MFLYGNDAAENRQRLFDIAHDSYLVIQGAGTEAQKERAGNVFESLFSEDWNDLDLGFMLGTLNGLCEALLADDDLYLHSSLTRV